MTHSHRANHSVACDARTNVYVYEDPALNHGWMTACESFAALRSSPSSEQLAEVGMLQALTSHPRRVHDPTQARLVYLGIFEYASWALGDLSSCSAAPAHLQNHSNRMREAAAALRRSPVYARCSGCDHIWATSATNAPSLRLVWRIKPLDEMLRRAIPGVYRGPPHGHLPSRRAADCAVQIPYEISARARRAREDAPRPLLLQFAGSLDVCCSGQSTRCAIGALIGMSVTQSDISIAPTVRERGAVGPCLARALTRVRAVRAAVNSSRHDDTDSPRDFVPGSVLVANALHSANEAQRSSDAAMAMRRARFCLVPPGDTFVTSRLSQAVAAGCVPVLFGERARLQASTVGAYPWPQRAHYDAYAILVHADAFRADPASVVHLLRRMDANATEMTRRRDAMARLAMHVLYRARDSAVASNFVDAIPTACFRDIDAAHECPRKGGG